MQPTELSWVQDAIFLLPLLALMVGTFLQAEDSLAKRKSYFPESELYLVATYISGTDFLENLKNLFGRLGRDSDDKIAPSAATKALRAWQGWFWLLIGSSLATTAQTQIVLRDLAAEVSPWMAYASVLTVFIALLVISHRHPMKDRRRIRDDHTRHIVKRVIEFYSGLNQFETDWPYWVRSSRVAIEPGDSKRVVVMIEPTEHWSPGFYDLVGMALRQQGLRPKGWRRYKAKDLQHPLQILIHQDDIPPEIDDSSVAVQFELDATAHFAWLVRFGYPRELNTALANADQVLKNMNVAPWSYEHTLASED